MASIQDFVSLASKQLGIGEDKARTATGGLLGAIQSGSDAGDFQKLVGAIPGASGLVGRSPAPAAPSGGGLGGPLGSLAASAQSGAGGLMGSVGSLVGGKAGGALGLLGALKGAGLSGSQGGDFVKLFLNFAKDNAGPGLVGSLTSKMPELAKFLS